MLRAVPFLRWPGGKRWLAPLLGEILSGVEFERYFEPFLGGGALFFSLRPRRAQLSDINEDLIATYRQVKRDCEAIESALKGMEVSRESFEYARRFRPPGELERAVRFLYLNRTAFSGIYRVNQKGEFNVPYGGGSRTPEVLWRDGILRAASKALGRAQVAVRDFEDALACVGEGDLVYCDPTYTVRHNNNGFRRYNEALFSWKDQERLAAACRAAVARGARVVVSNACNREVIEVFRGFEAFTVQRFSSLNPRPKGRREVEEVVLFSWVP